MIEPQDDREIDLGKGTARFDQIGGLHIEFPGNGVGNVSISPEKFEQLAREAGYLPANEK